MDTLEDRRSETLNPEGRKALLGAFVGFFVDSFDIYLPVVVLAPAIAYFVSPNLSPTTTAVVTSLIFASTLVGRPLGALVFGHYADKIGRRRVTIISVVGFGTITLLMALMPGYQQLGATALVVFILLRFVNGVFLGGEYTAANPLAMEYSPRSKRGLYSGLIQSGAPLAFVCISLLTLAMLSIAPAGDLNSPYVQWGWRVPFLIGAVLAFGLAIYFRYFVEESELFRESEGNRSPVRTLLSGNNLKNFLQVFVLMSGFWLSANTITVILPGILGSQLGLASADVTVTLLVLWAALTFTFIGAGALSQLTGRRTLLMILGGLIVIVGTPLFFLLISVAPNDLPTVVLLSTAIAVLGVSQFGIATAYITERFRTGVRATGFGLGYSLAIILPSFFAFYQAGLASFIPFEYTALVLFAAGGLLMILGAAWGPETKNVDFIAADAKATQRKPI